MSVSPDYEQCGKMRVMLYFSKNSNSIIHLYYSEKILPDRGSTTILIPLSVICKFVEFVSVEQ